MSNERRHHTRITFHAPARLQLAEQTLTVEVLDLSFKGALLGLKGANLNPELPVGAHCILTVPLDESGDEIRMDVAISHQDGANVGLACRSIDLDSVTHLRRVVELNLGDAGLLERELSALIAD